MITANGHPIAEPGTGNGAGTGDAQRLRLLREQISQLVAELPGDLSGVTARMGDVELEVTWTPGAPAQAVGVPQSIAQSAQSAQAAVEAAAVADSVKTVVAPLVGTFYRAMEPGAKPFVEVGDEIVAGQTIGIIEAMKLMNYVESEWAGTVVEVLAANATAVEFGQALVRVEAH